MKEVRPGTVAGFRCIHCGTESRFEFPAYRCACGGNLELRFDPEAVRKAIGKPTLGDLARRGHFAWLPLLPVTEAGSRAFSLTIGGSPLVERGDLARVAGVGRLLLKDDTRLPSASFKDRASSVLVAMAAERGIGRVCTASTGNAGCSMACLCADAGLEAIVFVPATAPKAKVAQLLFYGARVIKVAGTYDDAFDLCWKMSQKHGWLNRSTGWNPFTREGKKTVSFEIVQQLDWQVPEAVLVPVGDGNIISGVWKGFTDLHEAGLISKLPRIVAVQSTLSNAVSLAVARVREGMDPVAAVQPVRATTRADSISVDLPRDGVAAVKAVVRSGGDVVEVTDDEIRQAIVTLAGRTGIFAEPAGATAYAGLSRWAARQPDADRQTVVCLVTGNGLKDVEAAAALLPAPIEVKPGAETVPGLS
ncbi:MAG: threonine synthase [Deltaproteobacteria bacterium]|nr:threonine synthase [Deltaproteobacteria bacterium]